MQEPKKHLRVEIHFKNGVSTNFLASEFDINLDDVDGRPGWPRRFTYKMVSGEEAPLYIVPSDVAGIVVSELHR